MKPVFRKGDTYAYPPDISEDEAHSIWTEATEAVFVAEDENGTILGTYYIKPNPGVEVCNCGYITAKEARGLGVASKMCEHSLRQAKRLGYQAMQYNCVAATNEGAVRLWQRHGFEIIETLSGAFTHKQLGQIDAYVMYRKLD